MTIINVEDAALECLADVRELSGECRRQVWIDALELSNRDD